MTFQGRKGVHELVTSTKTTPQSESLVRPSIDLNITWLLQQLNEQLQPSFTIDRSKSTCRTPRRNVDTERAIAHFRTWHQWGSSVRNYFVSQLFPIQSNHGLNLGALTDTAIYVPVVPLFEDHQAAALAAPPSPSTPRLESPRSASDLKEKKEKVNSYFLMCGFIATCGMACKC